MTRPESNLLAELSDLICRDISSEDPRLPEVLFHLMSGNVTKARALLSALYLGGVGP